MSSFAIDGGAAGANSLAKGIGNALQRVAMADSHKNDAYLSTMGKVKTAEEARGLQITNEHRLNADQLMQDPAMTPHHKAALLAFKLLGKDANNFSKSAETEQGIGHREAIIQNPALALPVTQAHFATSGKAPFDNISDTGYSINQATGEATVAHPGLAKLFHGSEGALANQRNASAGESSTRAARIKSGLDHTVTALDENGKPMVTALPTGGGYQHIAPAKTTTTGVDATNAKAYNAIVTQVEKDMPGAKEDKISAEVEARWARRSLPNKNPAPSPAAPTMNPSVPAGYKLIGTSGGKPVYQAPDGKKYTME